MTVIFSDGFESGDLLTWTGSTTGGTGTINATNTKAHTGSWSALAHSEAGTDIGYVYYDFVVGITACYLRSWIWFDSYLATNSKNIGILQLNGFGLTLLRLQLSKSASATDRWNIQYRDAGNINVIVDTPIPNLNEWTCIEIATICSTADGNLDGAHYVWMNEGLVWNVVNVDTDVTEAVSMSAGIRTNDGDLGTHNYYFDDVVMGDARNGCGGAPASGQILTCLWKV